MKLEIDGARVPWLRSLWRLCLMFLCLPALGRASGIQAIQAWSADYELIIDGQHRGHARIEFNPQAGLYRQTETLHVIQLRKRIELVRDTLIRRRADGQLIDLKIEESAGLQRRSWTGELADGVLDWRATEPRGSYRRLRWLDDFLLADTQLLYLHRMREVGTHSEARSFDQIAGAWHTWRAELQGADRGLRSFVISSSGSPDQATTLELDERGQLHAQQLSRLGQQVHWRRCLQPCEREVEQPLDMLDKQALRSPHQIPRSALAGPIRYVFSRSDGQAPQLLSTPEQSVLLDGVRAIVTICADCGAVEPALNAQERERYLQSNPWLQLEDPRIRRFAFRAGPKTTSAHVRMQRLEQQVAEQLPQIDMLGYKDAVTALESGRGDCTETAVLLAAAARAQGIPARIVAGLAYSDRFSGRRDVFAPHYWVQAWVNDRWTSYDAGLLGFDATHIALAFGDGDPAQTLEGMAQLGLLQIEQMGQLPKAGK